MFMRIAAVVVFFAVISCDERLSHTFQQHNKGVSPSVMLLDLNEPAISHAVDDARNQLHVFLHAVRTAPRNGGTEYAFRVFISEDGIGAHPWVIVDLRYDQEPFLVGKLASVPRQWRVMQPGQPIRQDPAQIFDWRITSADGSVRGAFTTQAIARLISSGNVN